MKRSRVAVAAGLAIAALALSAAACFAAPATISESGSPLLYPLVRAWVGAYEKSHGSVRISASAGGQAGIARALTGAVQIGASDSFQSDDYLDSHPGILDIPVAVAAESVVYNLPTARRVALALDGPTIAKIYSGSIRYWDDPAIAAMNRGVPLPHRTIVPIRRSDDAGATLLFTQFLTFTTPAWANAVGAGSAVNWPHVDGAVQAAGSDAVVRAAQAHRFSIAYVPTVYDGELAKRGVGTARLANQKNEFLLPAPASIEAAASALDARTPPDERLTLVYAPGAGSYPIVGYEYVIVRQVQRSPQIAGEIRDFLLWTVDRFGGNDPHRLAPLHFVPLPEYVRALSVEQIEKIR